MQAHDGITVAPSIEGIQYTRLVRHHLILAQPTRTKNTCRYSQKHPISPRIIANPAPLQNHLTAIDWRTYDANPQRWSKLNLHYKLLGVELHKLQPDGIDKCSQPCDWSR